MQKETVVLQAGRSKKKRPAVTVLARLMLALVLLSVLSMLLSACSGDPHAQQQANQNRISLNQALQQARDIGMPQTSLDTIILQKQALDQSRAPLTLFNDQAATDYYHNLAIRYQQLRIQTQGVVQVTTEQLRVQTQTALLALQKTLAQKRSANLPVDAPAQIYQQNAMQFKQATTPGQYLAISRQVNDATATLNMLPDVMEKLKTLGEVIALLKGEKVDVSEPQQQYNDDKAAIVKAVTPSALQQVGQQIDNQNQQLATQYQQLIPDLVTKKLDELEAEVQEMQKDGIDVTAYRKLLDDDRARGSQVKTMNDFLAFSKKVSTDKASWQGDLLKGRAIAQVKQFHQEVQSWANAHMYYDKYDGKNYPLNYSYMEKGIGEDLDRELSSATKLEDYQQALTDAQNAYFHLQMLEQDYKDKTPYDQVHQTDLQLLDRYKLQNAQVIVVSTIEQALRLYENGKLVRGFLITAGRPELPAVPGLWRPLWRLTNTEFRSPYPKGSPYYYEPTKINYAILYHEGGYFLHDSWWRNDYGPGTQFYHIDSSGNVSASYGTHGCVNIREDQAAWLYNRTSYNTMIIIY
ncbi:MAG: L,D-transpeptidase [Ktedonobacteraceae bacterium]|nr:L,D-transpeptidase [Ktedonobacteraceae bacterium]